jgi:hypothetical protein
MSNSQADQTQADGPAHALPSQAAHTDPENSDAGADNMSAAAPHRNTPSGEEPELALEPDLPSDGRDKEGEAMIRDLPQRPELSEPSSQPDQTIDKP